MTAGDTLFPLFRNNQAVLSRFTFVLKVAGKTRQLTITLLLLKNTFFSIAVRVWQLIID